MNDMKKEGRKDFAKQSRNTQREPANKPEWRSHETNQTATPCSPDSLTEPVLTGLSRCDRPLTGALDLACIAPPIAVPTRGGFLFFRLHPVRQRGFRFY